MKEKVAQEDDLVEEIERTGVCTLVDTADPYETGIEICIWDTKGADWGDWEVSTDHFDASSQEKCFEKAAELGFEPCNAKEGYYALRLRSSDTRKVARNSLILARLIYDLPDDGHVYLVDPEPDGR